MQRRTWSTSWARYRTALICAALVTASCLSFASVLDHDFVPFDDPLYVTENPRVQAGLTWEGVVWAFTSTHASNWHPLTWLSHMLDVELYGLEPGGHHLTSLLLHALNAALLFLVLRGLTGATWRSALVAGLFALHPLRVESVAWVAERKDVLSSFFFLITLRFYLAYTQGSRRWAYAGVLGGFALGLMAKPMLVTLPFLLLLLDAWPLGRLALRGRLLVEKIPLFVMVLASCVVTYAMQQQGGAVGSAEAFPLDVRIATALHGYLAYLGKTFWPHDLSILYPHSGLRAPWFHVAGAAVALLALSAVLLRAGRRCPYLAVGWLWYLGTLVPVIGLVQVGSQTMADRYTYIPGIGLALACVWGLAELVRRWRVPPAVLGASAAALLVALAVATQRQSAHWANGVTLFQHAVDVAPENHLARNLLGVGFFAADRLLEAEMQYRRALELKPEFADARQNLGIILARRGRLEEAIQAYRAALTIEPQNSAAHFNLALALGAYGETRGALEHYEAALRTDPGHAQAHYNLATLRARQGQLAEAVRSFEASLHLRPGYAAAHNNLANTLVALGRPDEARQHYRRALDLDPAHAGARRNLAALDSGASIARAGPRRFLFLISADTLRADRLGTYGHPHGLTPNLDAFAESAAVFSAAYAPSSFTLASVSALLSGRYPEENGIVNNSSVLSRAVPTLASTLRAHGWRTGAVVSNFVLRRQSGLDAGFDRYDDRFPQTELNRPEYPERIAADTTRAALEMLRELDAGLGDVFLWVHYQDPHGPYTPPAGYRERHIPRLRELPDGVQTLEVSAEDDALGAIPRYQAVAPQREVAYYRAGYAGEIEYMDGKIGRLLDGIARRVASKDVVIVFASDHGESLGEGDYWFQHGRYLTEPLVRVPLLIRVPGRAPERRSDIAGLIDLYPTMLAYYGIAPPEGLRGRDLLAPGAEQISRTLYLAALGGSSVRRFGLVTPDYLYLVALHEGQNLTERLLPRGGGGGELSSERAQITQQMRVELNRLHWSLRPQRAPEQQELSPEDREKLRALGYLGGE